jgi:LacI family transcriptional regulator
MTTKDRKQAITMHEIARRAGVSQSTVSRVLNGSPTVDPAMQAAVLKVMEEVNYRPNISAQGLVRGKTRSIGILTRHLGSPFFGEVLRGTVEGINGSGYSPVIALGSELRTEDTDSLMVLLDRRVDALIWQAGGFISDEQLHEIAAEIPLIIMGRRVEGLESQCVYTRAADAAYRATSYLIEKGHTSIAHITGKLSITDGAERRDGYLRALIDHRLPVIPELIAEGDFSEASGIVAAERLLSQRKKVPFTAIFTANDQMAFSARLALYRRGLNVPDDISLMGFDDLPGAQYAIPPLTTIRQPAYQMGVLGAQAALAALNGQPVHIPQLPLELVIRESVAIR